MNKNIIRGLIAVGAFAVAGAASAAPLDVSPLVTTITDTLTPIGQVGMAVLSVAVGVKVFSWIRRAL